MPDKRIKPSHSPKSKIPKPSLDGETIRFSFKYFDDTHDQFSFDGCGENYFPKLFERLKNYSTMKAKEMISNRSKSLRCHQIPWEKTIEKEGFKKIRPELWEGSAFQMTISGNEHGRIHGFFIANVFFLVWLDPDHNLQP